jgi:hypothetical protein
MGKILLEFQRRNMSILVDAQDSFWLYVIEQVEAEDGKMYCIQNPASLIDYYLFDHGWINVIKVDGSAAIEINNLRK